MWKNLAYTKAGSAVYREHYQEPLHICLYNYFAIDLGFFWIQEDVSKDYSIAQLLLKFYESLFLISLNFKILCLTEK